MLAFSLVASDVSAWSSFQEKGPKGTQQPTRKMLNTPEAQKTEEKKVENRIVSKEEVSKALKDNKKHITISPSLYTQLTTGREKKDDLQLTIPTPFSQNLQVNLTQLGNVGIAIPAIYVSYCFKDQEKGQKNEWTIRAVSLAAVVSTYRYLMGQKFPLSFVEKETTKQSADSKKAEESMNN